LPKLFLIPALLITFLVAACSGQPSTPVQQEASPAPPSEPTQEGITESAPVETLQVETAVPDCLEGEISPIGGSIAEEYEFTSYEEVITWFCNGAEFEDILVALETESQTGTPAEEMLQMLADGFTWEEIWQLIGLTE
jgi:hypothetical protein